MAAGCGNRKRPLHDWLKLSPQPAEAAIEQLHHRLFAATFAGDRKRKAEVLCGADSLLPNRKLKPGSVTGGRCLNSGGETGCSCVQQEWNNPATLEKPTGKHRDASTAEDLAPTGPSEETELCL